MSVSRYGLYDNALDFTHPDSNDEPGFVPMFGDAMRIVRYQEVTCEISHTHTLKICCVCPQNVV